MKNELWKAVQSPVGQDVIVRIMTGTNNHIMIGWRETDRKKNLMLLCDELTHEYIVFIMTNSFHFIMLFNWFGKT